MRFIYFPRSGTVMHVGLSAPGGLHREVATDSTGTCILGVRSHDDTTIGQLYAFHANFLAGPMGHAAAAELAAGFHAVRSLALAEKAPK